MASKVLSIEIGNSLTKVAEVDYKAKKAKIYNSFVIQTPTGMVNTDGEVTLVDSFVLKLQQELAERKISTKNVIFVVNAQRVVSRTIVIPYIKESRVHDFVITNASDYFPYSLAQYEVACDIEGVLEEDGIKKLQVTVNCMPNSIVNSYMVMADAIGFNVIGLDTAANAIKKMMLTEIPEDIKITFKVEENSTIITVIENNKVVFQRTANYGVDEVLEAVSKSNLFGDNMSDEDALLVVNRKTVIFKKLTGETNFSEPDENAEDFARYQAMRIQATNSLAPLIGNITKILDAYDREKNKNIQKIYLVGLGSTVGGLSKLLSNELNIKVVASQQFGQSSENETEVKTSHTFMALYFTNCGAGLEPLSIIFSNDKNDRAKSIGERMPKNDMILPIVVCTLCILASAGLIFYGMITNMSLRTQNAVLRADIDSKKSVVEIYNEYVTARVKNDAVVNMDSLTAQPNDAFLVFISEMEEKMPADIMVSMLTATEEGVSMGCTTTSKESAAEAIMQLRTFDTTNADISVSGLAETVDDNGVKAEHFEISVRYKTASTDAVEE